MAEPPLLTLTDVTLGFGGRPLFEGVTFSVAPAERLCIVGRNGSGKSTLMKIAAGLAEPDRGERFVKPGTQVAYLPQDPDLSAHATLADYVAAPLPDEDHWRADAAMDGLKVEGALDPATASGGERRRAALARLLAMQPDLMLLDEPTNHLDIAAIEWLEDHLRSTRAAFAIVSHDRALLANVTRSTLWLDRGEARLNPQGFAAFEEWRDRVFEEEEAQRHKLNRLIREESRWAVEGISARRKRNQGRVRRLQELRAQRSAQIARTGAAAMALSSGERSGKLVIEAEGVSKSYEGRTLFRDFSIRVARGERIAFVGPNGVGKTTLLKVLTGELPPDTGSVRLGTNLRTAVLDQRREALKPGATLWDTLVGDPELAAKGQGDQVMVRGRPRHVVAYLKDFLFDERQARGPVSALSGGERARLLLARIMARESNLLILDEPTNDLDVETLDLLEELIDDYDGTVLVVSHDRDFLDRVATTTIAMEGDGRAVAYAGGWSDYRAQRAEAPPRTAPEPKRTEPNRTEPNRTGPKPAPPRGNQAAEKSQRGQPRLGYARQRRLEVLPDEIARLEAEIAKLGQLLSDPGLYARDPAKFGKATEALAERQHRLAAAEEEWLELESLRESLGGG